MTELHTIFVVVGCTLAALVAIVFCLGRMSLGWWPR